MDFTPLERLRVYLGDTQLLHGKPVYEIVVRTALEQCMAGATVSKGFMGYGGHLHIHTAKILQLSEDLPVVVEIVDTPEKIAAFVPLLTDIVSQGLVTRETVQGALFRPHAPSCEAGGRVSPG